MKGLDQRSVVAVKSVTCNSGVERRSNYKLQVGDIVEQLRVVNNILILANAPFSGGKAGLQSDLRNIYNAGENVIMKVRRVSEFKEDSIIEVHACVVADEGVRRKKQYFLADANDRNCIFVLMDALEEECYSLQAESRKSHQDTRNSHMAKVHLKDCLLPYSWQQKMQAFLPCPNSGMVFSLLFMPFQPNCISSEFYDLEETSARAMAWLSSAQTSGVPITFLNIQIEPILMQASGSSYFGSSSKEDLPSLNSGKYTIQDWEGTDIHIIRALRLWFAPAAAELAVNLNPSDGETRLGVGISRTDEGFCFVSSVEYNSPADLAGLKRYYYAARAAQKLLVISRIAGEKVTPWTVNSSGSITCFDTVSISEKLSAHRDARQPIQFHVMLWDGALDGQGLKSESSRLSALGVTEESAPAGCSFSYSSSRSPDVSTQKHDRHHLYVSSTSSKPSSQNLEANGDGSTRNVNISAILYPSLEVQMESMWSFSNPSVQSKNSGQDGSLETPPNEELNNRMSQAAWTLESAATSYQLPVDDLQPDEEEKEFSFRF